MSNEYTVRLEEGDKVVFSVIAPDGRTIVHQCEGRDYDYYVDAQIAANHYMDKRNLQLYKDELATAQSALQAQSETITRQQQELEAAAELLRVCEAEKMRYREAMEAARQALSNQTHGGAQYQPDVLEADSILSRGLSLIDYESEATEDEIARAEKLASEVDNQAETIEETPTPNGKYDEFWAGVYTFPKPDNATHHNALIAALIKAMQNGFLEMVSDGEYRIRKDAPDYLVQMASRADESPPSEDEIFGNEPDFDELYRQSLDKESE